MMLIHTSRQLADHPASLLFATVLGILTWSIFQEHPKTLASRDLPPLHNGISSSIPSLPQALPTPIALYHFDGDFTDSSGNGQNLGGGVGFTTGKFGQAAQFNGGELYVTPLQGFPTGGPPWSIAMWIRVRPLVSRTRAFLFAFYDNSGYWAVQTDQQHDLGLEAAGSQFRPPCCSLEIAYSNLQIPEDNNFHHLVVRGAVGPRAWDVTFTLDGTTSATIRFPWDYYGPHPFGLYVAPGDADLDEMVIVDGLLNEAQIAQLQTRPYDFQNSPPTAICKNVSVTTNSSCEASITASDVNDGSSDPEDGSNTALSLNSTGPFGLGQHTVMLTATDNQGASSSCAATVTVTNPAPVVSITTPPSGSIFPVNIPVSFAGSFADNPGDIHAAQWMFDSISQPGVVSESSGTVSAAYSFATAGVYAIRLTVNDSCGGIGTANQVGGLDAIIVIYDPSDGFVTGGGWFNSPTGAYTLNPSLAGRANFGFVSRYQKGATVPTGETEFQFQVANFNFHSTSYQWLVVSGARAQYKGIGIVNGTGSYGFMLTAIDGQVNGDGGLDKLRIKIWDKNNGDALIYDNQLDSPDGADPATLLGGGSIVVHK